MASQFNFNEIFGASNTHRNNRTNAIWNKNFFKDKTKLSNLVIVFKLTCEYS